MQITHTKHDPKTHYATEIACTGKRTINAAKPEVDAATRPHFPVINHIISAKKRHA
jgi:hypothetical protein